MLRRIRGGALWVGRCVHEWVPSLHDAHLRQNADSRSAHCVAAILVTRKSFLLENRDLAASLKEREPAHRRAADFGREGILGGMPNPRSQTARHGYAAHSMQQGIPQRGARRGLPPLLLLMGRARAFAKKYAIVEPEGPAPTQTAS